MALKAPLPLILIAAVLLLGLLINPVDQVIAGWPAIVFIFAVVMVLQAVGFTHAWLQHTERLYDLFGSLSFVVAVVLALALAPSVSLYPMVMAAMVIIWAVRLGSFLLLRIIDVGEDRRFRSIKQSFWSFLTIWTLQGVWVCVTSSAALVAITASGRSPDWLLATLGAALWFAGFVLEVIADRQKQRFRTTPANTGQFICSGVWALCRHPNYLGEIVLWTGIFIAAMSMLAGWQFLTVLSPVLVAVLLTKVSGIPALARRGTMRWGGDPAYQAYLARTPLLVPRLFGARRP